MWLYPIAGLGSTSAVYPRSSLRELQGMDVYAEGSQLHAVLVGKTDPVGGTKVVYLLSKNDGASWSQPVTVNRKQDGAVMSRRGNDAQLAAVGGRVVVAFRRAGEFPESGPMVIASSKDGGASWRRGANPAIGDTTHNQSYLDVLAESPKQFHLVWMDDREENGNSVGLRYARSTDSGLHWQPETTLDPAVCTCCWNRLALLPDHSVAVLYRDDEPHDMRLVKRLTTDSTWRQMGTVGDFDWRFNGCPHCGGGISSGSSPQSLLHGVVWSGKAGIEGLYYLNSADLGEHWSAPLRIADGNSRESDIATLDHTPNQATVGVVYAGPADEGVGIHYTESSDQGKTWSQPKRLSKPGAIADHPRIMATPAGFRVFWTEKQAERGKVWAMYSIGKN